MKRYKIFFCYWVWYSLSVFSSDPLGELGNSGRSLQRCKPRYLCEDSLTENHLDNPSPNSDSFALTVSVGDNICAGLGWSHRMEEITLTRLDLEPKNEGRNHFFSPVFFGLLEDAQEDDSSGRYVCAISKKNLSFINVHEGIGFELYVI